MANRYGKLDVAPNTGSSTSTPLRNTTNVSLAQDWLPTVNNKLTYVTAKLLKNGTPTGNLWIKIYSAGANPTAGTLLATSYNLDVSTIGTSAADYVFFFQSVVTFTSGQQYYLVLEGDYTLSGSNYISWSKTASSTYVNGMGWIYSSGSWASQAATDFSCAIYTNADGGNFDIDSDGTGANGAVSNADRLTLKGNVAPSTSDMGYVYNGKTVLFDANESCKQWIIGDTSSGAASAGQKYGFLKVNPGVTITFLGDATANISGFLCNPTTPGAESINSSIMFNGTSSQHIVLTNSVGSANASNRWQIYNIYGYPYAKFVDCQYSYEKPFYISMDNTRSYNLSAYYDNITSTPQFVTPVGIVVVSALGVNVPITATNCTMDMRGAATSLLCAILVGFNSNTRINSGGSLDLSGFNIMSDTTSTTVSSSPYANLFRPALNLYASKLIVSTSDVRPTQVIPTGLTFTDLQDGTVKVEVSNIASIGTNDQLVVYLQDGTAIYRVSKSKYVAATGRKPANCGIIGCLSTGVAYSGMYAKYTSDNSNYSDASAVGNDITPTYTPIPANVRQNVQYGQNGTTYTGTMPGGTATLPSVGDVRKDTQFGYEGALQTGTLVLPPAVEVKRGSGYGAGGTELYGTLGIVGGNNETVRSYILRSLAACLLEITITNGFRQTIRKSFTNPTNFESVHEYNCVNVLLGPEKPIHKPGNDYLLDEQMSVVLECWGRDTNDPVGMREKIIGDIKQYFGKNYYLQSAGGNRSVFEVLYGGAVPWSTESQSPLHGVDVTLDIYYTEKLTDPSQLV